MTKDDGRPKPRNCMKPSCADFSQAGVKKGLHRLPTQPSETHHENPVLCDGSMAQSYVTSQ